MFEILIMVAIGMLVAWFIVPPPKFVVSLKNALVAEFPSLRSFVRTDVD